MGTFDDYLQQQEDPLFTPIGGYQSGGMSMADDPYGLISSVTQPTEDYSTAMEQLYTPISTALPEPEGTFNTPTFSLDAASDPFSKLLNEQIKESSLISDSYSEKLAEISDRQSKLTNSAENDWSTLGAALVGGIGGLLAGGTAAEIAGGAASVGTTHYNNLEAQEKQKQALLTQDANRLLTEQKIEQSRTGQLRNTQAQAAARLTALQAQGKVVGSEQNLQAQEQKKELKDKGDDPMAAAKELKIRAEIEKPVRQAVDQYPSTIKPVPGAQPGDYLKNYTGTPMAKVEDGYKTYLEGVQMVMPIAEKGSSTGSQWTMSEQEAAQLRVGQSKMADGRRQMAEVGQAITDSEWTKGIAPYLVQIGVTDITDPFYSFVGALDKVVVKRGGLTQLRALQNEMEKARASFYLSRNGVVDKFDYSRLSPTALGSWSAKDLTAQSFGGKTLREQMNSPEWFGNSAFGSNAVKVPEYQAPPTNTLTDEQKRARLAELEAKHGKGTR